MTSLIFDPHVRGKLPLLKSLAYQLMRNNMRRCWRTCWRRVSHRFQSALH